MQTQLITGSNFSLITEAEIKNTQMVASTVKQTV